MLQDQNTLTDHVVSYDEARALTDKIQRSSEQLWILLLEANTRRVWTALGYPSWREYAKAEFSMGQSHAYRLLDQGRVIRALQAAANSPIGEISEHQARQIKPHLTLVTDEIQERIAQGETAEAAVTAAIRNTTTTKTTYLGSRKRVDRSNRFVEHIAGMMEDFGTGELLLIDYSTLDHSRVPTWIEEIRLGAQQVLKFARRLEREVQR